MKRGSGRIKKKKLPHYLVEMAGVYWTASRLCSEGLIPSIPPRNLPRFDLPVTDLDGRVHATVQVKTRATRQGWIITWYREEKLRSSKAPRRKVSKVAVSRSRTNIRLHARPNHFYVLVDISDPSKPETTRALVIPSSVVRQSCLWQARRWRKKPTRAGKTRRPFPLSVDPRRPGWEKYWDRWDLIRGTARR